VNQLLPYEQKIADKFSHAAIPDMADEIWANIDAELGSDTPGDDGGGNNPVSSSPSGTGLATGFKFLIVAVVTIAVLFIVRKRNANKVKKKDIPVAPAIEKNITKDSTVVVDSFSETPAKSGNKEAKTITAKPIVKDSLTKQVMPFNPSLVKDRQDSIATLPPVIIPPENNPTILKRDEQPIVPVKKGKGAKGIKDADYKIIPKRKDSL
jgi:hypothetical protein